MNSGINVLNKVINSWKEIGLVHKLLYLYLLFVPIMLLHNRYQIQISEVIFFLLLLVWGIKIFQGRLRFKKVPLGIPISIYLGTAFFSIRNSIDSFASLVELSKMVYLAVLFILVVNIIRNEQELRLVIYTWLIATALVVFLGFIGIVLGYGFGIRSLFAQYYDSYPYIGRLYRATSTMYTAKMLTSFLIIGLALSLSLVFVEKGRLKRAWLLGLIFGIFGILYFTLSRGVLGIGVAAFIVLLKVGRKGILRLVKFCLGIGLILLFIIVNVLATWYFLDLKAVHSFDKKVNKEVKIGTATIAFDNPKFGVEHLTLDIEYIYTSYFHLKKSALVMLRQHPIIGVGIGTFNHNLKQFKEIGKLPKELPAYDPHSTFFGHVAETGIIGLLALIWLLVACGRKLLGYSKVIKDDYWALVSWGIFAAFIGLVFEGINMNIMNFRYLWGLLSIGMVVGEINVK